MPWWSSWKTACCASVPVPPQVTGAVGHVDRLAVVRHRLAVRFHLQLLEIERQQPQPFVIGEDAARLAAELLDIEPVGERGDQRHIRARLGEAEMAVHLRRAFEQRLERIPAERQRGA